MEEKDLHGTQVKMEGKKHLDSAHVFTGCILLGV